MESKDIMVLYGTLYRFVWIHDLFMDFVQKSTWVWIARVFFGH